MKLIAALSWYDEPVWALTELVASLGAAGINHIVAVDGAYGLYPGGRAQSPGEQAQAIISTAQGLKMGVDLHVPRTVWIDNETEKRSFLFAAAHLIATPGDDWIWICDADEVVTNADGLRETLESTPLDAGEILLEDIAEDGTRCDGAYPIRKLFRAQPSGIEVQQTHFRYVAGNGRVMWNGGTCCPGLVDAELLWDVRVAHRKTRTPARTQARLCYSERRDMLGIEIGHVHAA